MNARMIEIRAATVDEARNQIYNERYIVLEENIVDPGDVGIIESVGDTAEKAFIKARSRVPAEAVIESQIVRVAEAQINLQILGDDEKSFGEEQSRMITSVSLIKNGRKGFLGFGKTSNIYEIVLTQQAVVEIRFRTPAVIQAKIRDYSAGELLQSVHEARQLNNAQTEEILQLLNPKNHPETGQKILRINEIIPGSVFDIIEEICRKNEKANWQSVIDEAHLNVLIQHENELKKEKIRLRTLDVEIAESFHFFTSIDWNPNGNKEPTGLPKDEYDEHHLTDERLRKTIPEYSTDEQVFKELDRRIKAFGLYELYVQSLLAKKLNETNATLEEQCIAALEAQKIAREKASVKEEIRNITTLDKDSIDELKSELLSMCMGDQEMVDRLIDYERNKKPDANEQELYESSIERIRRDND